MLLNYVICVDRGYYVCVLTYLCVYTNYSCHLCVVLYILVSFEKLSVRIICRRLDTLHHPQLMVLTAESSRAESEVKASYLS